MDKRNDENGDILVNLFEYFHIFRSYDEEEDIIVYFRRHIHNVNYSVSDFLRRHNCSRISKDNLVNFIDLLDKNVYIDTSDPKYSHIYQGIDMIVKRLLVELTKIDQYFAKIKLRRTGSSISDGKVGLTHESDYVL